MTSLRNSQIAKSKVSLDKSLAKNLGSSLTAGSKTILDQSSSARSKVSLKKTALAASETSLGGSSPAGSSAGASVGSGADSVADFGAIPDKPSPAGSASLAGSKEILDRPSLSDCLVSLKKKSEGSNEPEPFNEPGPIVLAQNSMRFYRRLALVLAGVTIALLAFITIDRAERPGPEAWSQEGGFRRESEDIGLHKESEDSGLREDGAKPTQRDSPPQAAAIILPDETFAGLGKCAASFEDKAAQAAQAAAALAEDDLSAGGSMGRRALGPQTSPLDPDADKLWHGLRLLFETPPAAGEDPGSLRPDLAPNQRKRMTPFSEIEARAHGDLAEVWEAVLEARRGHLAGGGAIEASEGTPILEWTLGELSRLDPESNPAQKLSPEIMVKVGWAATAGQAARDETGPALRWYRKAVSLGGAEAIFELAKAYDDNPDAHENNSEFVRGLAVSKSGSEAVRLYAIAAEAGLVKAQLNLCVSYHHGEGVKRSYAKAFQWCEKAGAQGNAKAQLYVGDAYYHGRGVKRDLVKSVDWYLLAAGNGSAEAWLELGYAYEKGEGAQEDLEEAFSCYSLAANAGLPDAQYNLAELLYFGRGTEKDEEKAFEWYAKAAEGGSPEAKIRLAEKRSR